LVAFIGGGEHVFGPIIQQLLAIKAEIEKLLLATPRRVKLPLSRLLPGLNAVSKYKDLAKILPDLRPAPTLAFNKGAPNFGFVGVDDAAALLTLAAMALTMALLLVLIIQSPAFRKAVSVRAKELDRIMRELQINAAVGLKESVDIVNAIFNGSKDEEQRCRQSPTFEETPQCIQALREFSVALTKMQSLMPRLISLLNRIINYVKFPHSGLDIMKTRLQFNKLLADAQSLAFELQIALADMREKCKCPDLP
jgi:hypothetical protein